MATMKISYKSYKDIAVTGISDGHTSEPRKNAALNVSDLNC